MARCLHFNIKISIETQQELSIKRQNAKTVAEIRFRAACEL